jgi:hypothetical protein
MNVHTLFTGSRWEPAISIALGKCVCLHVSLSHRQDFEPEMEEARSDTQPGRHSWDLGPPAPAPKKQRNTETNRYRAQVFSLDNLRTVAVGPVSGFNRSLIVPNYANCNLCTTYVGCRKAVWSNRLERRADGLAGRGGRRESHAVVLASSRTSRPGGRRSSDLAWPGRRCRIATTNEQHHSNDICKSWSRFFSSQCVLSRPSP